MLKRNIEGAKSLIIHSNVDGENTGPVMSSYATSGRIPVGKCPICPHLAQIIHMTSPKKLSFHLYSQFSLNTRARGLTSAV